MNTTFVMLESPRLLSDLFAGDMITVRILDTSMGTARVKWSLAVFIAGSPPCVLIDNVVHCLDW